MTALHQIALVITFCASTLGACDSVQQGGQVQQTLALTEQECSQGLAWACKMLPAAQAAAGVPQSQITPLLAPRSDVTQTLPPSEPPNPPEPPWWERLEAFPGEHPIHLDDAEMEWMDSSVRPSTENRVVAFLHREYKDAQPPENSFSERITYEYDCILFRSRLVAITSYSKHNLDGDVVFNSQYNQTEWKYVAPGTRGETELQTACSQRGHRVSKPAKLHRPNPKPKSEPRKDLI
jgi:hypothetical protein